MGGWGTADRERLAAEDGQELELVVALAAWDGGIHEQKVRLVRIQERLAVQLDDTQLGVLEALNLPEADPDFVAPARATRLREQPFSDSRRSIG